MAKGLNTTQFIRELTAKEWQDVLNGKEVVLGPHALDHLDEPERKVFKSEDLIYMISRTNPRRIFLQANGRYAVYCRTNEGYRKIIVAMNSVARIVTYMDNVETPKWP